MVHIIEGVRPTQRAGVRPEAATRSRQRQRPLVDTVAYPGDSRGGDGVTNAWDSGIRPSSRRLRLVPRRRRSQFRRQRQLHAHRAAQPTSSRRMALVPCMQRNVVLRQSVQRPLSPQRQCTQPNRQRRRPTAVQHRPDRTSCDRGTSQRPRPRRRRSRSRRGCGAHPVAVRGTPNQTFSLEDQGDGTVRIVAQHSGLVLDVAGAGSDLGAPVVQWPWHGGANQRFRGSSRSVTDTYGSSLSTVVLSSTLLGRPTSPAPPSSSGTGPVARTSSGASEPSGHTRSLSCQMLGAFVLEVGEGFAEVSR